VKHFPSQQHIFSLTHSLTHVRSSFLSLLRPFPRSDQLGYPLHPVRAETHTRFLSVRFWPDLALLSNHLISQIRKRYRMQLVASRHLLPSPSNSTLPLSISMSNHPLYLDAAPFKIRPFWLFYQRVILASIRIHQFVVAAPQVHLRCYMRLSPMLFLPQPNFRTLQQRLNSSNETHLDGMTYVFIRSNIFKVRKYVARLDCITVIHLYLPFEVL
jgi:hypothetical protein